MINTILACSFLLLLINYLYFILRIHIGLKKVFSFSNSEKEIKNYYISLIIPFRNESNTILNSLRSIESQNYPKDKFEVIYVNDCSTDDSLEKIQSTEKSSNIKVISVPENYHTNAHKKRAVKYAIENSSGDIIVTTDCDCIHTKKWLTSLISYFEDDTVFVAGPVSFIKELSFFDKLQKLEFSGLILAGAGLIGINKPVICNAANLAYRKDVFEKVNGFNEDMSLSSGDDELLMQRVAANTQMKIRFCKEPDSIVLTEQHNSLKSFLQQRKRWASKGLFYKDKLLIIKLIFIYLFYLGLFVQPILTVFMSVSFGWVFIFSLLFKIIAEYSVLLYGKEFLFSKKLLKVIIPAELFQVPYIVIAGLSGAIGNYTWKERKIKR